MKWGVGNWKRLSTISHLVKRFIPTMDELPPHIGKVVLIFILGFLGVLAPFSDSKEYTPISIETPLRSQDLPVMEVFYAGLRTHNIEKIEVIVTGYSSEPEQTDPTPFITANGERVGWGGIATNCLEFGTYIEIDGQMFRVNDRMNKKYDCMGTWRMDIWFPEKKLALSFGAQTKQIRIWEN